MLVEVICGKHSIAHLAQHFTDYIRCIHLFVGLFGTVYVPVALRRGEGVYRVQWPLQLPAQMQYLGFVLGCFRFQFPHCQTQILVLGLKLFDLTLELEEHGFLFLPQSSLHLMLELLAKRHLFPSVFVLQSLLQALVLSPP